MVKSRRQSGTSGRSQTAEPALAARGPPVGAAEKCPVVGIGASAGGLDACTRLLDALPPDTGMAFILVQHLDPTHESLMADLLSSHTTMTVVQAIEGMRLEADHVYVIPPGTYLSLLEGDVLHVSAPEAPHGARLPFDFLLNSMADQHGSRASCVILSGTGADGSIGVKALKQRGGFTIAEDPDEAAYDGMPRSAIATGAVDAILPIARMPEALIAFHRRKVTPGADVATGGPSPSATGLARIIDVLRTTTGHDFRLYKQGTLRRRIERRMAKLQIATDDLDAYGTVLESDKEEQGQLVSDLLINVTSFFRDPGVFETLANTIIPDLVGQHSIDQPLRIWIAGCSTGEETYSLAMLFREAVTAAKREIKLQIFASDIDADAVAAAREGHYPPTIAADVSAERLARFFSKDGRGYRVLPELRATIVFAVQDVLSDPPFSRLDMVSCRNLLIYLQPEAQQKVIAFFHFALRQGGILLLGSAETIGEPMGRFEVIAKAERLYRHVGHSRPGEAGSLLGEASPVRQPARGAGTLATRQSRLAEGSRRLILDAYAPAAVLINPKTEWLFSLGPTERYLRVPPGHPTYDLLAMVPPHLRAPLRTAIQQVFLDRKRVVVAGGRTESAGPPVPYQIAVQPARIEGEDLVLVCFIDDDAPARPPDAGARPAARGTADPESIAELEQQLEATRGELQSALRSLEASTEDQKAFNEEALSINEEYQSTNEELLTSKEELQSLNEELTALNVQLQETLDRQRTTASDLQNILYSTDVATIFLDTNLRIRFFTPATKALFNIIPSDIGRPLADLNQLAGDSTLLVDARTVLRSAAPIESEIQARDGLWYVRRILPYRGQNEGTEGVVITFVDVTERRNAAEAVEAARKEAQQANIAKSRFLAAASHDLRQPLQALSLMRGVLARRIRDDRKVEALALVDRLDETAAAMTSMLNSMLDINQLEAGTVRPHVVTFPISDLLSRLHDEFAYHAGAKRLELRMVSSRLMVRSDPRLLEQIIRNLLSNALKYTKRGKVLLGCRRRGDMLSIGIWDTGLGIAAADLGTIFDEYHQLDNKAHDRERGLGLGLSIVKRLADLLGHPIEVRSEPGRGSVFSINVLLQTGEEAPHDTRSAKAPAEAGATDSKPSAKILIVEDDTDLRELLEVVLKEEGHRPVAAADGMAALALVDEGGVVPDMILADYNLPNDLDGLVTAAKIRDKLHRLIPVMILTGDISTETLKRIAGQDCVQLNKPVKTAEVMLAIQRMLASAPAAKPASRPAPLPAANPAPVIFVIDDDNPIRETMRRLLEADGHVVEDFESSEAFLAAYRPGREGCLIVDAALPGLSGLDLLRRLQDANDRLPSIMITGASDVATAVAAMKAGASDFIEKPASREDLIASIARALAQSRDSTALSDWRASAAGHLALLTARQREIMDLVLAGHPSKNIAADIGISQRTVENHRAAIMKKTGAESLPALARLAVAAASI